jgi:AraC-like DNA-binding protein
MAVLLPDVSFPLLGGSTAALRDQLRLRLLHLGGVTIDERWNGRDMRSPLWRIYVDLDDGAAVTWAGRTLPLRAGAVYVVPAWLRWSASCRGRVRHGNALLDLPALGRERVERHCDRVLPAAGPGSSLAAGWLRLLKDLAAGTAHGPELHARGHALAYEALAAAFAGLGGDAAALLPPGGRGSDLVALIDQRIADHLPVAALCRALGISPAELGRRCQRDLGTSPARLVRTRRLARAVDLLREGLSVAETARRCGFADRVRFSKVFADGMGLPPAAWRRAQR